MARTIATQLDFVPSHGDKLQSEYFVPQQYAIPAIAAVQQLLYDCATIVLDTTHKSVIITQLLTKHK